jgi:hypothetical protein
VGRAVAPLNPPRGPIGLDGAPGLAHPAAVATGRRVKKSVKSRPKVKQERALKARRRNAKLAAARKKSRNGIKERRKRRGKLR